MHQAVLPCELELSAEEIGEERLSNLRREEELAAGEDGRIRVRLDPLAYGCYRLGGLDYAVRRSRE